MKRISLATAVSAALIVTAWAADLSGFIGKSVQDKVGGYQLFNVPAKASFVQTFGSVRYQRLLTQMQGDGIKSVTDPELGQLLVTSQCVHHDCPNQSVLIAKFNATVVGLCMSDVAPGDPNSAVVEWSGVGWSVKRTVAGLGCRGDTPEASLADFKAARQRAM